MKKYLTLITLFLFFASMKAQFTLESTDLAIADTQEITFYVDLGTNFSHPSEGENQNWDLTGFFSSGTWDFKMTQGSHAGFPGSTNLDDTSYASVLGGVEQPRIAVRKLDSNGFYSLGLVQLPVAASLAPMTGVASDSLKYLYSENVYSQPFQLMKFPGNYGDNWSSIYTSNLVMKGSATPFNLFDADLIQRQYIERYDSIVGWGTLTVNDPKTNQTIMLEALLQKEVFTRTDTFYLNGAVAPNTLIQAFGNSQGQTFSNYIYRWWVKGLPWPAVNMDVNTNGVTTRTELSDRLVPATSTGINKDLTLTPLSIYPNPAQSEFHIEFENPGMKPSTLVLYDMLGKAVFQTQLPAGNHIRESIDPTVNPGLHQCVIKNEMGQIIATDKVLITE